MCRGPRPSRLQLAHVEPTVDREVGARGIAALIRSQRREWREHYFPSEATGEIYDREAFARNEERLET